MPIPTGTVTFLFSDIEGSTQRWERHTDAMEAALRRHDELLHAIVAEHGGHVFKTVGDEFCTVFSAPGDALAAALAIQQAIEREDWSAVGGLSVRMAVHTGVTDERGGDYYGRTVNRVARLMSAGHGRQILVSTATAEIVRSSLPAGCTLHSLGSHRLKDLAEPEHIYQLKHVDLAHEFPALKTLDARPNNLPLQISGFIGRDAELAESERLLGKTRVLTLAGAGGVGKTRLALQLAANVMDEYTDGVWFVDLSSLTDTAFVASTVLAALVLREEAGKPVATTLQNYLKAKRALIVLDNCEQLIEECARLTDALQRGCAELRIVATSREALGIGGETVYRIPTIADSDAVQIFVARAEASVPSFALSDANASAVAQICRRLDCIPMAIELAAARVKIMTPQQIIEHLDDRFRVLTGGSRTASARQQTLRGLIQWSVDLLSEPEKAMLRRLSVFASDWPLKAASVVCAGDPIEDWESLDILTKLVDKSLVNAEPGESEHRYRLLESTRAYAGELLAQSAEAGPTYTRHAAFWLDVVTSAHGAINTPLWPGEARRLRREYENVRAVLGWAILENRDLSLGSALASGLRLFWYWHGQWREGRYWFEELLQRAAGERDSLRGSALLGLGTMTWELAARTAAFQEALDIFERIGDQASIAIAHPNLATVLRHAGEYERAERHYETSLALSRAAQRPEPPTTLYGLARLRLERDLDVEQASALAQRALPLARAAANDSVIALVLTLTAELAAQRGDRTTADDDAAESVALVRPFGSIGFLGFVLTAQARVFLEFGELDKARDNLRESMLIFQREPETDFLVECWDACVRFAAAIGAGDAAARLRGFSDAFREAHAMPRGPAAERRLLGLGENAAAYASGRAMGADAAIALMNSL